MPVTVRSRYWNLTPIQQDGPSGPITSLPVRRVPPAVMGATVPHVVTGLDTIESVAAKYYARSDAWWHVADANPHRFPLDLPPGLQLQLPSSTGVGRVLRTRGS